jgi:hypothetical protein
MHHRYSCLKGKAPLEVVKDSNHKPVRPGANTKLAQLDELPHCDTVLILFIRTDRQLDIFGEKFTGSKDLVYLYVKVLIITEISSPQVCLGDELVQQFEYQFPY